MPGCKKSKAMRLERWQAKQALKSGDSGQVNAVKQVNTHAAFKLLHLLIQYLRPCSHCVWCRILANDSHRVDFPSCLRSNYYRLTHEANGTRTGRRVHIASGSQTIVTQLHVVISSQILLLISIDDTRVCVANSLSPYVFAPADLASIIVHTIWIICTLLRFDGLSVRFGIFVNIKAKHWYIG